MRGCLIVMSAWLLAACDTDAGEDPQTEDVTPGECGDAVRAPTPDPTYRSNTPDAEVVATHTTEAQGLVLVSSNLWQEDDFRRWFSEVRNESAETICYPQADLRFKTADGRIMANIDLFWDAPPYEGLNDFAMPCLAPGEHGYGWSNELSDYVADVDEVTRIEVDFDGNVWDGVRPHPLAPTLSALVPVIDGDDVAIAGTMCNGSSDLHHVWVNAYGVTDDGLVDYGYDDFIDGTFAAGDSWTFEIPSYGDGNPVDVAVGFVDFWVGPEEDGAPGAEAPRVGPEGQLETSKEQELALKYREFARRRAVRAGSRRFSGPRAGSVLDPRE